MQTLLRAFFYLIYQPLAWSYDAVAWLVSLGRWRSWVASALRAAPSQGRILELGHGPGHLQVAMRKAGGAAFGLDLSQQMGRLARRRLTAKGAVARLVRSDGRRLPFRAGAFDAIVATFPTEYIVQPGTLNEVRRVLARSGRMVLLPVAWITGGSLLERAAAWLFRITGEAGAWDGRLSTAIRAQGFAVQETRVHLPGSEVMLLVCTPDERD